MKYFKTLFKSFLSGITALAILSVIILGYYFVPLRENNPNHNTDYVWKSNSTWVKSDEGVSFGKVDANGFNNFEVIEKPDIIILGSSHAEAMNLFQTDNMCSLLNDAFKGKYQAYNMGISGHTIYKVTQYLRNSLSIYEQAPKYVIIETGGVGLTQAEVSQAISGDVPKTEVVDTGLLAQMQKVPYFRLMYHQLDGGMLDVLTDKKKATSKTSVEDPISNEEKKIDETPYETLLSYFQDIEKEYNTKIIVMFHPTETLMKDGSISFSDADNAKVFAQYAQKHNVGFVDMTENFEAMYYNEHHVPHGFSTGELGVGHINKYGHAAIADRLYQYINELEEK